MNCLLLVLRSSTVFVYGQVRDSQLQASVNVVSAEVLCVSRVDWLWQNVYDGRA